MLKLALTSSRYHELQFSDKSDKLDFFGPNFLKNGSCDQNLKNLSLHLKSAFSIHHVCQFSVKMDSFKFFGLNLGKLPNYVRYFGSNNVEAVAESWVETEMSWLGVEGAGWRWVDGSLIPNFNILTKKHVVQSNDGIYLAIPHLDLGGNDVVHKFDSIKRSRFYVQVHPHGSVSAPAAAFFYFIPPATIKTSCNGKRNFVFPLIFIGRSLALNSLSNHLKVTFEQTLY